MSVSPVPSQLRLRELLDADWRRLLAYTNQPFRPRRLKDSFGPRFAAVVLLRRAQRLHARNYPRLAKLLSFVNFIVFGLEVPPSLQIGPGLVMPHTQGTVVGAGYVGQDVTIFHQVTLGAKHIDYDFDTAKRPHVCDRVVITCGAKILGPVRIGEGAVIGANAVVVSDVPPNALAVGVPARIVDRSGGDSDETP